MLVNKYNFGRRFLYRVYRYFPMARLLKRVSIPLKVRRLRQKIEERKQLLAETLAAAGRHPLFDHIEIETLNRCNADCAFCPVNRHIDPRPATRMSQELFTSILEQLRELDYDRNVYLFSNNEPLLDTRIFDWVRQAHETLPKARVRLYTNGVLLTLDKFKRLIPYLDNLTVNNYCEDFRFQPHLMEIHDYAQSDPALAGKFRLVMRYQREIMTSRAGQSPNKQDILSATLPVGCLLPARQLIVRPDGKLSLCCNDAFGAVTLGDLTKDRIIDAWNSEPRRTLRRQVLDSRSAHPLCQSCDTLYF